jgi:SAM-dependent methyltransferase
MSLPQDTAARFDRISDVYDETREPLSAEALDRIAALLTRDDVKRILEAGVGTGRIALPLQQRSFEVVGVDLSKGMLMKAREKGVQGLICGDANRLPLRDKEFDAAMMSHVVHLLENPARTFESLSQVASKEIVVLIRKRDGFPDAEDGRREFREAFGKAATELGYPLPERAGGWRNNLEREREFLASFPPTELVVVEDRLVTTTLRKRLLFFEKHPFGYPSDLPDEAYRTIAQRVAESSDIDREFSYRRGEQMAIWRLPR